MTHSEDRFGVSLEIVGPNAGATIRLHYVNSVGTVATLANLVKKYGRSIRRL